MMRTARFLAVAILAGCNKDAGSGSTVGVSSSATAAAVSVVAPALPQLSALDVCHKLEATGVASKCREQKPGGLGSAADEKAEFDLVNNAGHTGQVLHFENDRLYQQTVESFDNLATIAGPHRYKNAGRRIFVQMNEEASLEDGKKVKAAVAAL